MCDISGSMGPYARALLQFMYVTSRTAALRGIRDATRPRTEVFTFATRLTRLTPALAAATPETMLARAGEAAADWAGGTRIGGGVRDFMDRYGVRGMARGSVILIISDGWETGDPALLGAQMARLHRLAYRVVWANPRTQSERYRPEVGGMAAAWPYCDAVVSAHNFDALGDLLAALRAPSSRGRPVIPLPVESPEAAAGLTEQGGAPGPLRARRRSPGGPEDDPPDHPALESLAHLTPFASAMPHLTPLCAAGFVRASLHCGGFPCHYEGNPPQLENNPQ